jgi:dTDP-4-dehydrorhamnose reductase
MTLNRLYRGHAVIVSDQDRVSPTYVPDLVHGTLDLLLDGESGIWHLANQGAVSWFDLAYDLARQAQQGVHLIRPDRTKPGRCTALSSGRGLLLPALDQAMTAYHAGAEMAWAV